MRTKYHLTSYIWKAERQQNESIHYHITTNVFIPYYHIRDEWNNLLNKHGYLTEYKANYNNESPNSTDVHKVYKIKDIAAYLSKYISKNEPDKLPIEGKVWDCSLDLKKFNLPSVEMNNNIGKDLIRMLESGEFKEIDLGHSTLIKQVKTGRTQHNSATLKQVHYDFIQSHKQFINEQQTTKAANEISSLYNENSTNSPHISDNDGRSHLGQGIEQDSHKFEREYTTGTMDASTTGTGSNFELHQRQLFDVLAQPFYRINARQSLIDEYKRTVNYS